MDYNKLNDFIDRFSKNVRNYEKVSQNKGFFTMLIKKNNGQKTTVLSKSDRTELKNIKKRVRTFVELNDPDIIQTIVLEAFDENSKSIHISSFLNENETPIPATQSMPQSFDLNGPEVQSVINRKIAETLAERDRKDQHEKMVKELEELRKKTDDQEKTIEELEEENETLSKEIEIKNSIQAAAGTVGSLLESLGIKRERVGGLLGGLLGVTTEEVAEGAEAKRAEEKGTTIPADQSPSEKAIEAINEYLYTLNPEQLRKMMIIFGACQEHSDAFSHLYEFASEYVNK